MMEPFFLCTNLIPSLFGPANPHRCRPRGFCQGTWGRPLGPRDRDPLPRVGHPSDAEIPPSFSPPLSGLATSRKTATSQPQVASWNRRKITPLNLLWIYIIWSIKFQNIIQTIACSDLEKYQLRIMSRTRNLITACPN